MSTLIPDITKIPAPRTPLIDERTGLMSREWYRFFYNLFNLAGSGGNFTSLLDLQKGPPTVPFEALQIDPNAPTNAPTDSPLVSQVAEIGKQINALELQPECDCASVQAVLQNEINGLLAAPIYTPQAPMPVYGSFYSTADQPDGSTTTAYPLVLDTTQVSQGVALENRTATFTASIGPASTTMTVTAVSAGPIYPGMVITGTGVTAGTYIVSQTTGTDGSTGDYVVSALQTVASATITGTCKSKITLQEAGVYNVQFSIQFVNTDSGIQDMDVWMRKNGTDVADSNSRFSVPNRHGGIDGHLIGSLNLFVDAAPSDYVELMWATTNSGATIEYIGAQTGPVRPATPSAIVTVSLASVPSI
jgi:hypothetical protein